MQKFFIAKAKVDPSSSSSSAGPDLTLFSSPLPSKYKPLTQMQIIHWRPLNEPAHSTDRSSISSAPRGETSRDDEPLRPRVQAGAGRLRSGAARRPGAARSGCPRVLRAPQRRVKGLIWDCLISIHVNTSWVALVSSPILRSEASWQIR